MQTNKRKIPVRNQILWNETHMEEEEASSEWYATREVDAHKTRRISRALLEAIQKSRHWNRFETLTRDQKTSTN